MRIALRKPRISPAPRAPVDLAARVTERARLMRERRAADILDLGEPIPGRSALDHRIAELGSPSQWVLPACISAVRKDADG
jgi:hypothetical protein